MIFHEDMSMAPPAFTKDTNYEKWKTKLEMWQLVTSSAKDKEGPTLFLVLDDNTQEALSETPNAQINCDNGVKNILVILDKLYLKDKTQAATEALEAFFSYTRDPCMSIKEYINEFDKRYNKIKHYGSSVSDDCLGFRLLKSAALSVPDEKLVKSHGTMTYHNVKTQLKRIMSADSNASQVLKDEVKVETDTALYTNFGRGQYGNSRMQRYPRGGFSRGFGRVSQGNRGRGTYQAKGTNPLDQYGNVTTCICCGSRNHWIEKCPDKKDPTTYYQEASHVEDCEYIEQSEENYETYNVTLFQSDYDSPKQKKSLMFESFNCAIIDCGASKTVCGQIWFDCFVDSLNASTRNKIDYETSQNIFKFGDGRCVKSTGVAYIPATIGKIGVFIKTDIVPEEIPLLLSKYSLKKGRAEMNFLTDTIDMLGQRIKLLETKSGHYVLPITEDKAVIEDIHRGSDVTIVLQCKTELSTEEKALKLHRQFAHPRVEKLLKLLKNAGNGDEDLVKQVKKVSSECKVCREYRKAPPRPVVGLSMGNEFNDCVAMDLKKYQNIYLLHLIDHATRLSACAPIRDKRPETIIRELFKIWIQIYGFPRKFLSDNGGEFSNEKFRTMCGEVNVNVNTTAAESPWSNGLCERHNAIIADMIMKVREDTSCSIELAVAWSINAKNSLANVHGFSPYQLVFGKNPRIPNILTDKPPALYAGSGIEIVRNNLNALHKAREEFVRCESSEKLRRALRHNVRSSGDIKYVTGDRVYYKRLNEIKWQGPATVLGQDGQQVLVKHGGVYVRVHPCRLQLERKWRQSDVVESPAIGNQNVNSGTSNESSDEEEQNAPQNLPTTHQSRTTEERSTPPLEAQPDQRSVTSTEHDARSTSQEARVDEKVHIKPRMRVEYLKAGENIWKKAGILSRSGKAKGKYGNSWNVVDEDDNEVTSIDFDRDVVSVKVIHGQNQETVTSALDMEQSTEFADSQTIDSEEPVETITEVNYSEIFTVDSKTDTLKAKVAEMESWNKNRVYEEVEDSGQNCVSVRWVVTPKVINGELKVKARLVARGFEEVCNFRTDSPTCMRESIRIILLIIASMEWKLHSIDYKTAFLQGKEIERDVFLRPPTEFRKKDVIWKLKKTVYGLADAPRVWFLRLKEEVMKLGARVSSFDNGVFYWHSERGLEGVMASFVDDQLWGGTHNFEEKVIKELRRTFDISCEHDSAFKYVGIELSQGDDYSICINQNKYIEGILPIELHKERKLQKDAELTMSEKRQFRGLIGQLNWISGMSRPDISFEVCQLSTMLNKPTVSDVLRANKVVRHVKGTNAQIKVPNLGDLTECEILTYTDASFASLRWESRWFYYLHYKIVKDA